MIDVYANAAMFGDKHQLAQDLARAVMRWEAVPEIPLFADNTAAFIHDLPTDAISTASGRSDYVRLQVLTPAGVLDRDKQLGVVKELTEIVAQAAGDATLAQRTWVLLTESPEGGWGIAGHATLRPTSPPRPARHCRRATRCMPDSGRSASLTADGRGRVLADGMVMPLLGLGVWQVPDGPECVQAVRAALDLGYRHIDTAQAYGNEASVGRALRESGLARDDVFITTKFYPGRRDPLREAAYSIERLGVDYVDLYIVHWPAGGATWAWPGMEAAHARSYARAIGVSNFDADELDQVLADATVAPVVDQVQFNPSAYRQALLDACDERAIALEAYSPLGTGRQLRDPVVGRIAQRLGRSPAQILLRWCVQRGIPVVGKSTHRERIAENAQIFDYELPDDAMGELDALDRTGGTRAALERKWW
jgi:2,5-diketo-D-gluconate reductase A